MILEPLNCYAQNTYAIGVSQVVLFLKGSCNILVLQFASCLSKANYYELNCGLFSVCSVYTSA